MNKIDLNLAFHNKRDRKLITPCCNKTNTDGKFVNYKNLPLIYGYCHSCGKASLPPTRYQDDSGKEYIWNDLINNFEPTVSHLYHKNVTQLPNNDVAQCITNENNKKNKVKHVDFNVVTKFYNNKSENALLCYLRNTYGNIKTDAIKKMYYIGTSKDKGTIFWNINSNKQVQKAKVSYYNRNGKRTNRFKVPYKNIDGYYSCLFGEHLLQLEENIGKPIVLVESEKTALVSAIHLPEYVWLGYGGINGLTDDKLNVLKGKKIIIVPDMSEKAVSIMNKKIAHLHTIGIVAKIWDMTNGKTDEQLKIGGWYNCDLEDVFRTYLNN